MRTLIRAVTLVVLLSGVAGIASAQRGWVDVGIGPRPWVRGHVVIGPRHPYYGHYRYARPHAHYRGYRRPYVVVGPRLHYRRPVVIHRGHRSHYRWH